MFNIDPMVVLLTLPGIIVGFAFHEFAHAYAADKLGDPTPRSQGRLTLDPLPHIDIVGLILIILAGFGWAKPVEVNPRNFKNPRRDDLIVSLAGPMMNVAIAFAAIVFLKLFFVSTIPYHINQGIANGIWHIGTRTVWINLVLFVFNLLPLYPLDGYHIFMNIIPFENRLKFHRFQRFSRLILLLIIITPVSNYLIRPIVSGLYDGMRILLKL